MAKESGKSIAQGAAGWKLAPEQIAKLDAASAVPLTYPYWHQRGTFLDRNPPAV